MRAFILLHGLENLRPPEHWQHWLSLQLRERGEEVHYPQLPHPMEPLLADWAATLDSVLAGTSGRERVVLCHSLSCLTWLRHSPALQPGAAARLLLVSPPDPLALPPGGIDFSHGPIDFDAARRSCSSPIRIVSRESDPYSPNGAGSLFAEPLGAELDLIPGEGHINPDDGYGPWPAVLEWCEDPATRLAS
ncbi:MAG: serine hydrolase [Thermoleophilaceae bacterium]|jgi:predicted alpha/beta hydrolase family esterase|nr:serine hydrolase [Thermoleophilaceae bacterium]